MENIYKVKIKTNPDPRSLYPSERRYSASTVLGLSICHLIFCGLSLIFALLSLINLSLKHDDDHQQNPDQIQFFNGNIPENPPNDEILNNLNTTTKFYLILTPLMLAFGGLFAGFSGILAWKRWYIDNNIKWFFFTSLFASFLSAISITYAIVTIIVIFEKISDIYDHPHVKIHLNIQILITSILELVVAVISTTISYAGMKNSYPDDMMVPNGRGKIQVNTILKGNKRCKISPPDILNHFHIAERLARYFPRNRESNYLPKEESNAEYQERVRQFLSSHATNGQSVITY